MGKKKIPSGDLSPINTDVWAPAFGGKSPKKRWSIFTKLLDEMRAFVQKRRK